ncbi:type III pantothenate kinase [Sutterella sp.]|uniref:type III pantothenate kinase n=1 Tax=Sutterella sp. TaxID=1981025 RepID=UPI0026E02076|nr:type III pantothenate kinase [Sutterella sp.]MDO5530421.1 type III pantothenate kinase [Sutterella sp.]
MKTLLIDLGNTALKWAPLDEELEPTMVIHRGRTGFKSKLYADWLKLAPDRVLGCTVAAPELAFSATKFFNEHGIAWQWVRSQAAFESEDLVLRSRYDEPTQLGADRWCAALGAIDTAEPGESVLVVQMGTATTVDAVFCEAPGKYVFLGGRIAPGPSMMQSSLSDGITALSGDVGDWNPFPTNTRNAIGTGILDSQTGLVRIAYDELVAYEESRGSTNRVRVVLAGGAAKFAEPRLRKMLPEVTLRHNLVLLGLAAMARHKPIRKPVTGVFSL